MPDLNDYYAYKRTSGGSDNGGGGFGCGWIIIVMVAIMLIYFITTGVSLEGIGSLLGIGLLVFLFVRWIFS